MTDAPKPAAQTEAVSLPPPDPTGQSAPSARKSNGARLATVLLLLLVLAFGAAVTTLILRPDLVAGLLPADQPSRAADSAAQGADNARSDETSVAAGEAVGVSGLRADFEQARQEQEALRQTVIRLEERLLSDQAGLSERVARAEGRAGSDQNALRDRLDRMETSVASVTNDMGRLRTLLGARVDALSETGSAQSSRFDAFNDRLVAIESAIRANPLPKRAEVTELRATIDAVQERLAAVERALDQRERRLVALEDLISQGGAASAAEAALVLAIGQLREAVATGDPFLGAHANVGAMLQAGLGGSVPDDVAAAHAALGPMADRGVMARAELRQRFADITWDIAHALPPAEDGSWLDRTATRLGEVVRIRPTGLDVVGDGPEAIVARAEALVAQRSLRDAVLELRRLDGPAQQVAESWLQHAEDRLAAEDAIGTLLQWATGRMILLDRKPVGTPQPTSQSG